MAKIQNPKKVALFCSILAISKDAIKEVKEILEEQFGSIQFETEPESFMHTNYYAAEMGEELIRCFVSFEHKLDPGCLSHAKRVTNDIEDRLQGEKGRKVNLDPGYVDLPKVVLASAKDFAHRLYLGNGIFGEITLRWARNKGFEALPWTYPDYQTPEVLQFFEKIRTTFLESHPTETLPVK